MTAHAFRAVLTTVATFLFASACADDSSREPSAPDPRGELRFASGSGSGGDDGGGGSGGGSTTPTGTGSVWVQQGGTGHGRTTSSPAGIDCTIGADGPTGVCRASFAAGTRVKLDARAAANSKFEGWPWKTSCPKAPEVEVRADALHVCQPVFTLQR